MRTLIALSLLVVVASCQKDPTPATVVVKEGYPVVEQWVQKYDSKTGAVEFANNGDIGLVPLPARPEVVPTLIGGTPADGKDYPASFYSSQGNSRCTATLVGTRVLQLAAHCVGNGRSAVVKTLEGTQYSFVCTHAPGYANNATADWALCVTPQAVAGVPAEVLNQDPNYVKVGDKVLLAGFGCTQPGGSGGNDGVYRVGESTVTQVPSGNSNDIVTKGGAALCFGDSGGSAFKVEGTARKVISVNSRGNIKDTSYLSSVATDEARKFYADFASKNSVKLCGVHADAEGCRGGEPGPQVPPLPGHCKPDLDKFSACLFGSPRVALTQPDACRQAFSALFACEEVAERKE